MFKWLSFFLFSLIFSQWFKKEPVWGFGLLFGMLGVVIEVGLLLVGIKEPGEVEFPHEDDIAESGL